MHPVVLAVYLAISSLTFPFVWQTKVTFYNKDQSSSRKREKKREFWWTRLTCGKTFWASFLIVFSYKYIFFSLCVCAREKGWVRFPQFFYSLANIYTRVNAGLYSLYSSSPHFFIGPFYPFYYFPFFLSFFLGFKKWFFYPPPPLVTCSLGFKKNGNSK